MKYLFSLIMLILAISACGSLSSNTPAHNLEATLEAPITGPTTKNPSEDPIHIAYDPRPNDVNLSRATIFIEEIELIIRESYPPQISLNLNGSLPTPCHALRAVINDPDAEYKINVEVYTVVDPNEMCAQVLQPFTQNIDLGTFPGGHYTVWVNGAAAGEFDS